MPKHCEYPRVLLRSTTTGEAGSSVDGPVNVHKIATGAVRASSRRLSNTRQRVDCLWKFGARGTLVYMAAVVVVATSIVYLDIY